MPADRDFATMQDFIVGRLSDDECREFEDRLVREPELARELEQSLRMRTGLQQLRTQGYFGRAASRSGSFWVWAPTLAAAAVAALGLFLWLSLFSGPTPTLMATPEARVAADVRPLIAAQFTFVAMRGSAAPDLQLPSAGLIEIRAAPSARHTDERYRVTLTRQQEAGSAEPVATALAGLALSTDGYVHCYADASRLAPGSYLLSIQADTNTAGTADVFPFNLRRGGTTSPAR